MRSMTGFGVARGSVLGSNARGSLDGKPMTKGKKSTRQQKKNFAQAVELVSSVDIEVSIRSVNGRFLETRFHLPREYFSIENELKSMVSSQIKRGTVDIFITRRSKAGGKKQRVSLNHELASEYQKACLNLQSSLKVKEKIPLEFLMRLPGVLVLEEEPELHNDEFKVLTKILQEALKKQTAEREREGLSLKKELLNLVHSLVQIVESIERYRDEANKNLEQKLLLKFEQRNKSLAVEPQRFAQEVMLYLEKSDINEEIVRLREHLQTYQKALNAEIAEGKQLDFYTQELLREINTIGSKSQVAAITSLVVQAKTFIERLREQVQNLE